MSDVQDYLDAAQPYQRTEYERVRKIVHGLVDGVEETISYGIPTFKYKGTYLLYFGAFKNHMSVFPGGALIDEVKSKLDGFKVAKGTVQYTQDKLLPASVIEELVLLRKTKIDSK